LSFFKYYKRIERIDFLIRRRSTGNLESFARKIKLSKRSVTAIISEMKELGFPIKYDYFNNTYYYEVEGMLVTSLFQKRLNIISLDEDDVSYTIKIDENNIYIKRFETD